MFISNAQKSFGVYSSACYCVLVVEFPCPPPYPNPWAVDAPGTGLLFNIQSGLQCIFVTQGMFLLGADWSR
jgi:hypothetical protein